MLRQLLYVSVFVWLHAVSAFALDPARRITQYAHSAWRMQDGDFLSSPNAILQTRDGYIWIATDSGLMKYDGVRFVAWVPRGEESTFSVPVHALLESSDGTLWIGTGRGLLSWKDNRLHEHLLGRINEIIEDRAHNIWAARSRTLDGGLCEVSGERSRCIGNDDQMQLPYAVALTEDVNGNLWVGSSNQLMRWRDGTFASHFREQLARYQGLDSVSSVAAANDGSIWAAIPRPGFGLVHIVNDVAHKTVFAGTAAAQIASLFIDRHQSLWMGTTDDGVYRVSGQRVDHFQVADGLTSNLVKTFFEDREGNMWLATSKGLDCFRDTRVVTVSAREGLKTDLASSVLAASDGSVFVGNRGSLDVLDAGGVTSTPIQGARVTSLWQDHAQRLWVGMDNTLTIYEPGHFRQIYRQDGRTLGTVIAITEDREENIWVSAIGADRRLFRIRHERVQEEFTNDQIPFARLLSADPTGGIWLGLANGNLAHYRSGHIDVVSLPHSESALPGLSVDADGSVWASTRTGISHWKNGQIKTLTVKNGLPCDTAFSAIRDARATLWIAARCGYIAIPEQELARWWQQPDTRVEFRVFDVFDGALPAVTTFQPAVSRSRDGRLWFANDAVVQVVDPEGSRNNALPPPVHVEALRANRRDYAIGGSVRLPAHSRDVEIGYAALSFVAPQKVQFRYQLEGRDEEWQDAGTRRQAFYTDLRPGSYKFRVIASNNEGVWNEEGATVEITIAPTWYQTRAFQMLTIVAVLLTLWLAYRLRMRQVARALNARFDERLEERTQLARELHDTLLQTLQGSKILADTALDRPADAPALARALQQVSAWMGKATEEGRETVIALRKSTVERNDLVAAFQRAIDDCRRRSAIEASLTVTGDTKEMHPVVRDEIYRIGYEAIRNAYTHSRGSRVDVALGYGRDFTLRVTDDGMGVASVTAERGREGHFGLPGMRERAARIGATLSITTGPGGGTAVAVNVPGKAIFRKVSSNFAARMLSVLRRTDGNSSPH